MHAHTRQNIHRMLCIHEANGFCSSLFSFRYMNKVLLLCHSSLSLLLLFLFQIMFNIKFFLHFILVKFTFGIFKVLLPHRQLDDVIFEEKKNAERESQSWIWFCVLFFEITFAPHLFIFCILSNADARKSPYGSGLTIICVNVQT